MLDEKDISSLSLVINDSVNRNIKDDIAKKKINTILHNKSINTVIKELHNYVQNIAGNKKNITVLVVVMALLRRNLGCVEDIKTSILKFKLKGCLYGGLYMLLSGASEKFSLKVKLNDDLFENKYDYINCFFAFNYWEYILVFQAVKILYLLDSRKFEQLAFADQSKLILLNMVTYHLDIEPSNELIISLLQNNDELIQNIGFSFITHKITRAINDIVDIKRWQEIGFPTTKNIRTTKRLLKTEIEKCCCFLEECNEKIQASLLFNYILVHQNQYPNAFAYMLMSSTLQEQFVKQIKESDKIRVLKDVSCLVDLISRTPALNQEKKRISKVNLYIAITDILINFIETEKGIYGWNEQQMLYMKNICEQLPVRYIHKLRSYLINKNKTLMCEKIDELVRFKIYLKDKKTKDIIDGILGIVES